ELHTLHPAVSQSAIGERSFRVDLGPLWLPLALQRQSTDVAPQGFGGQQLSDSECTRLLVRLHVFLEPIQTRRADCPISILGSTAWSFQELGGELARGSGAGCWVGSPTISSP